MNDKLIVVVDDDPDVAVMLDLNLGEQGYKFKSILNAKDLFEFLNKEMPDLILLDLMLPDMNGFEICKALKEKDRFSSIPVIIISGKDEERDKVSGLGIGADDYIVKPFSTNELEARIRAVLRRHGVEGEEKKIEVGGIIVIDLLRYEVTADGVKVDLTATEFRILECLSSRKGTVFTRDRILEYLWGGEKIVVDRTIDVHIKHLREKLGRAGELIKNIRGVGYKIEEDLDE